MNDRTGQQLGNYRLVRLLGKGGFAEVYLGEHIHLATYAAIKVLLAHLGTQADVEGFRQEAQTIARMTHPHIVRVLDFDVEQGVPFLVMEYAPHGSLRAQHPRGQALPLSLILLYVHQVASALQHAHEQRLIHRDVKPDNMLLREEGNVVLSDFGIVTIAHSTSSRGIERQAGTPAYMSPEQMNGEPRPASDQYALAVSAYEWISGQLPFRGTALEVAMQHALKPPPSLVEQVPTLPAAVEQVVFTALAKNPKERFATVQAFATALEGAVRDEQDASTFIKPNKSYSPNSLLTGTELLVPPTLLRSPLQTPTTTSPSKPTPPTLPIEHLSFPTGGTTAPSTQHQVIPSIDGMEVLRNIRNGDISSNWRMFATSRGKLIATVIFAAILFAAASFMILVNLIILLPALLGFPLDTQMGSIVGPSVLVGPLLGGCLFSARLWHVTKNQILILMPEGFIFGDADRRKLNVVINFKEALAIDASDAQVRVTLLEEGGKIKVKKPKFSMLASSQQVALSIADAYEAFRSEKSDLHR